VAPARRGRGQSAHAQTNGLTTQGDQLAHNFGHGPPSLAAVLRRLNLLAFLFHTGWEGRDDQSALLRQVLARRQTLFQAIQAFMRFMVFDRWDHLINFMIRGLALESQFDTS